MRASVPSPATNVVGASFHIRISQFVIVSSFRRSLSAGAGNSYFSLRGPLLPLTRYMKSGTLYHIKAQWACLPVPECRARLGDSQWRGITPKEACQTDAVRLDHRRTARSLKTRTRPFATPERPPSAPWPAG